jgi:uncharacterized protein (DUF2252 family)
MAADHPTVEQRAEAGRAARTQTPRVSHAQLGLPADRDPVGVIVQEDAGRVEELVPIRHFRMLASPFAFYRGTASLMARDLAASPNTGLTVQLCGDAHLANFGGFASPDRALVFDLNDFDETHPGPFEWDVKRLAASFELAGRHRGFAEKDRRALVQSVVGWYRQSMREFAGLSNLAVWYARLDAAAVDERLRAEASRTVEKTVARGMKQARKKDSARAAAHLTAVVAGELQIASDPPLLVRPEGAERDALMTLVDSVLGAYRETLQDDRERLLDQYILVDFARKVVGVGSVGTRCWIALLVGRDEHDPLVLQMKEAGPSVLEAYLGASAYANQGRRVVEGQRFMQATSDIFLGWVRNPQPVDGVSRDFYVRQLWDWKTSVDLEAINREGLAIYAQACAWTLARAHARSGDRIAIAAYLGKNDVFDTAIATYAAAYADVAEQDYRALQAAAAAGRIEVHEG